MPITVKPVDAAAIEEARRRLAGLSRITPLMPLDAAPANKTVTLKLECLQTIGCFKIRPIGIAVLAKERSSLAATAVVPENAPEVKLGGIACAMRALSHRVKSSRASSSAPRR